MHNIEFLRRSWLIFVIVCVVALDCSLANVESDMIIVGSTDLT